MKFKKEKRAEHKCSCLSNYCCENTKIVSNNKCPVCFQSAVFVSQKTVKSIVKENKKVSSEDSFLICENPNCNVICFSDNKIFYTKDSSVPIDFKKDSKPKYACYCNKITYDDVKEVINEHKISKWKFVVKVIRGKIRKCDCLHKNPYGMCCTLNSFKKAIKEANFKYKGE